MISSKTILLLFIKGWNKLCIALIELFRIIFKFTLPWFSFATVVFTWTSKIWLLQICLFLTITVYTAQFTWILFTTSNSSLLISNVDHNFMLFEFHLVIFMWKYFPTVLLQFETVTPNCFYHAWWVQEIFTVKIFNLSGKPVEESVLTPSDRVIVTQVVNVTTKATKFILKFGGFTIDRLDVLLSFYHTFIDTTVLIENPSQSKRLSRLIINLSIIILNWRFSTSILRFKISIFFNTKLFMSHFQWDKVSSYVFFLRK